MVVLRVSSGHVAWLVNGAEEGFCNYLDIMTTPQNKKLRTAICVTSKNATIYGPTSGYTNGLINATHKEVPINPGASPLPMMTSPMNVATISVNACIANDFNQ